MREPEIKCPAKTTQALGEQCESLENRRPELVSGSKDIKVKCPAKINLTLEVLNKREDGFHNIQSVMQTINLFDVLTIKIEESDVFEIKLSGTSSEIPYDAKNLVHKAAKLFFDKIVERGVSSANLKPQLEKFCNVPERLKSLILQRSKQLRKDLTPPEEILWFYLRNRRFENLKFRRQVPFQKYIADFVNFEKKFIIELDGSQHLEEVNKNKDKSRDEFFKKQGFKVLRFYNTDIFNNIEGVLEKIYIECTPHPQPLSHKERGETLESTTINQNTLVNQVQIPSPLVGEGGRMPDEGKAWKISIHIDKNIPIAAGLAGGSTDAAGTFWGLNKFFNNVLSDNELHELCAQLGSDLNFCLKGGCQLATSRGEILETLPFQEFSLSLIKPKNLGISAKEAYVKFSKLENKPNLNMTQMLVNALKSGDADIEKYLHNDLEIALLEDYSELKTLKTSYKNSLMSGSGSTFFVLKENVDSIDENFWTATNLKSIPYGVSESL